MSKLKLFFKRLERRIKCRRYAEFVTVDVVQWDERVEDVFSKEKTVTYTGTEFVLVRRFKDCPDKYIDQLVVRADVDGNVLTAGYTCFSSGMPFYGVDLEKLNVKFNSDLTVELNGFKYVSYNVHTKSGITLKAKQIKE